MVVIFLACRLSHVSIASSKTMYLSLFFLVLLCSNSLADKCNTLDGVWFNQLGSEVSLKHSNDGRLYGIYKTAVERTKGAAGSTHSIILGSAPYNSPGATFAFSVVWRNGSSTTTWTGQCMICEDGHETLLTSWLLRSQVDTCIDKWKSTMIGRDTFTRYEQRPGMPKPSGSPPTIPPPTTIEFKPRQPCEIVGNWYNSVGSEMIIKQNLNGIISGEYRTAVEREKGAAGDSHSKVFGIGTHGNVNGTFAFFVVWNQGASVTGWVGQCHICGKNKTQVLETTWLLRSKVDSCGSNWKSTLYGENSFTRHEQKQGPRKHLGIDTPGGDGEGVKPSSRGSANRNFVSLWALFILIVKVFMM